MFSVFVYFLWGNNNVNSSKLLRFKGGKKKLVAEENKTTTSLNATKIMNDNILQLQGKRYRDPLRNIAQIEALLNYAYFSRYHKVSLTHALNNKHNLFSAICCCLIFCFLLCFVFFSEWFSEINHKEFSIYPNINLRWKYIHLILRQRIFFFPHSFNGAFRWEIISE